MLVDMRYILPNSLLLMFLVSISAANAGVYKGVSSDGEVVYSDVPFRASAEFNAPPIAVLEMPDVILDKVLSEETAKAETHWSPSIKQVQHQSPRMLSLGISLSHPDKVIHTRGQEGI